MPRRNPPRRRRRLGAAGALACALVLGAAPLGGCGAPASSHGPSRSAAAGVASAAPARVQHAAAPAGARTLAPARSRSGPVAVGLRVVRLVDTSRTVQLPDGTSEPRALLTYVRYPAIGPAGATDIRDAPAARAGGPYPLIVFGHGFAVTPGTYTRLLIAWARAGFVAAAPAFPLENAHAPGGPNEADLINQPADMSFVITRMLAAGESAADPLGGVIDGGRVAVSGQSDGGDTALAVGYDSRTRDPRVSAAVILSGAELPGLEGFDFAAGGPPLLATQGTADTINPPTLTETFFAAARRPKFLLWLLRAEHLPPYTVQQPQLSIVERVSVAFLDAYLRRSPGALARMARAGDVPGVAALTAEP